MSNNKQNITDIIVIFDKSGSMSCMGDEPLQSVNIFIKQQKKENIEGTRFSLIMFSTTYNKVIDNILLKDVKKLEKHQYRPNGSTSLNDVICNTIKDQLDSDKPSNKVLLIVTDGMENSSQEYSYKDRKDYINNVRDNYDWKVIFIGANLDVQRVASSMGIDRQSSAEFDQLSQGSLLQISRQTSDNINIYRRSRTEGNYNADIVLPTLDKHTSCPETDKDKHAQTDMVSLRRLKTPPRLTRQYTEFRSDTQSPFERTYNVYN